MGAYDTELGKQWLLEAGYYAKALSEEDADLPYEKRKYEFQSMWQWSTKALNAGDDRKPVPLEAIDWMVQEKGGMLSQTEGEDRTSVTFLSVDDALAAYGDYLKTQKGNGNG
jgi:hypothetical protein